MKTAEIVARAISDDILRNARQPGDRLPPEKEMLETYAVGRGTLREALRYLDGMTERERFNTRGTYARLSGDYQQCVEQFGELITRFAADAIAYNQRALCLSKLRQMREAVEDMRQDVRADPGARVPHDDSRVPSVAREHDLDVAPVGRELDGVGQQIPYRLLQPRGIAGNGTDVVRRAARNADVFRGRFRQHRVHGGGDDLDRLRALVERGVDQRGHLLAARGIDRDVELPRLGEEIGIGERRGVGRAQLGQALRRRPGRRRGQPAED